METYAKNHRFYVFVPIYSMCQVGSGCYDKPYSIPACMLVICSVFVSKCQTETGDMYFLQGVKHKLVLLMTIFIGNV